MNNGVLFAAFALLVSVLVLQVSADACTFSSNLSGGASATSITALRACLEAVPFSQTRRDNVVSGLTDLFRLHSFTDIATCDNCGTVAHDLDLDVRAVLSTVSTTPFANDYGMQKMLLSMGTSLRDAHTYYVAPTPLHGMVIVRPFLLTASGTAGAMVISVDGETAFSGNSFSTLSTAAGLSQSISGHIGKTVQSINGKDPVAFMLETGRATTGTYKGDGALFSAAVDASFAAKSLRTAPLPEAVTEAYVFTDGSSVTVELVVFQSSLGYNDVASLVALYDTENVKEDRNAAQTGPERFVASQPLNQMDAMMHPNVVGVEAAHNSASSLPSAQEIAAANAARDARAAQAVAAHEAQEARKAMGDADLGPAKNRTKRGPGDFVAMLEEDPARRLLHRASAPSGRALRRAAGTFTQRGAISGGGVSWGTYVVDTKTIAVLRVATFSGSSFSAFHTGLLTMAKDVMEYSDTESIEELIIDLSGNGGGFVLSSNALLQMMFKPFQADPKTAFQVNDFRLSQADEAAFRDVTEAYMTSSDMKVACSADTLTASQLVADPLFLLRGSQTSAYSRMWSFDVAPYLSSNPTNGIAYTPTYFFKKVFALTDGRCGSACSQFLSKAQAHGVLHTVAYGGLGSKDMDTSSFCGGFVLDWDDFVDSYSGTPTLHKVGGSADGRFNYAETYVGKTGAPREFLSLTADYYVNVWPYISGDFLEVAYDGIVRDVLPVAADVPTADAACVVPEQGSFRSPAASLWAVWNIVL